MGVVAGAHGLRGEVFVSPFCPQPDWPERLKEAVAGEPPRPFKVESFRPHKKGWIFKFRECDTRSRAEDLKNSLFFLSKDLFKSRKGDFIWLAELRGFSLWNRGRNLGYVTGFYSNGGRDGLKTGTELLVPFIREYISDIDFSRQRIQLHLPEGFPGLPDE